MVEVRTMIFLYWMISMATTASQIAMPGCPDKCGNVSIPYPFGTTNGCSLNSDFFIYCNETTIPPRPFLSSAFEVLNILVDGELRILTNVDKKCYDRYGNVTVTVSGDPSKTYVSFPFSYTRNKFVTIGCDTDATLIDYWTYGPSTRCTSSCSRKDDVIDGSCSGTGCCQTNIRKGIKLHHFALSSFNNHSKEVWGFNPCDHAFIIEESSFNFSSAYLDSFDNTVPSVLDWAVGNETCKDAMTNSSTYACKSNSYCYDTDFGPGYRCVHSLDLEPITKSCYFTNSTPGYRCKCLAGYQGNPYLTNGCRDIDECAEPKLNNCEKKCINTVGNFTCVCPKWETGDGIKDGKGCVSNLSMVIKRTVGFGVGLIVLVICGTWLYMGFKKRRLVQLKHKFFMQNGGVMLQQQLPKLQRYNETAKIFTARELEKATDKYHRSKIVGQGGFGTVYKGILADDRVVAIKKSKLMDQSQIEQFVNEVVVLSQINHRNVVRLVGCCLETQVPLLVYEFVSNGTLFDHIHDKRKAFAMSWNTRLKIAAETAGVLSYLHSAASVPIIHRDIKSTNILLDDNYIAKVSDFGASRLIPIDQTELTTLVRGTLGYLDPEYLLTSQLTEKSDVYSFGVVLVELITGKKALCFSRSEEERSLADYFLAALKEGRLVEIVGDYSMSKEENSAEISEVATLAERCLRVKGEERPNMKEVATVLDRLMKYHKSADVETITEKGTHYAMNKFSTGGSCDTSIVFGR